MTASPATTSPHWSASLEHLGLIWFVPVMGLAGLALAWAQAQSLLGEVAWWVAQALAVLVALVLAVLVPASLWRRWRWPLVWRLEWMHPVRFVFVAAVTVALILVATLGWRLQGPQPVWSLLWQVGAAGQALVTLAVAWRWQRLRAARWPGVTPALLIPVVGNVLAPLAGPALGHGAWAWTQGAVGALLWPLVLGMLVWRVRHLGPWPERMRPSVFVLVVPPSIIGLDVLLWPLAPAWALGLWTVAVAFVLWGLGQVPRCLAQPFGMPLWSLSFPLAAFASLSLRLADAGALPSVVALLALALASAVIAALLRATVQGLRRGLLLQPEPAPTPPPPAA